MAADPSIADASGTVSRTMTDAPTVSDVETADDTVTKAERQAPYGGYEGGTYSGSEGMKAARETVRGKPTVETRAAALREARSSAPKETLAALVLAELDPPQRNSLLTNPESQEEARRILDVIANRALLGGTFTRANGQIGEASGEAGTVSLGALLDAAFAPAQFSPLNLDKSSAARQANQRVMDYVAGEEATGEMAFTLGLIDSLLEDGPQSEFTHYLATNIANKKSWSREMGEGDALGGHTFKSDGNLTSKLAAARERAMSGEANAPTGSMIADRIRKALEGEGATRYDDEGNAYYADAQGNLTDEEGKPVKEAKKPISLTEFAGLEDSEESEGEVEGEQGEPTGDIANIEDQRESNPRKRTEQVEAIVFHTTGGKSLKSAVKTLNRRNLAYHYIIDKNGNINQFADPGLASSHMRNSNKGAQNLGNKNTIGIAYVGEAESDITDAQKEAGHRLATQLARMTGATSFYGHGELNAHKAADEGSTSASYMRDHYSPLSFSAENSNLPERNPAQTRAAAAETARGSRFGASTVESNKAFAEAELGRLLAESKAREAANGPPAKSQADADLEAGLKNIKEAFGKLAENPIGTALFGGTAKGSATVEATTPAAKAVPLPEKREAKQVQGQPNPRMEQESWARLNAELAAKIAQSFTPNDPLVQELAALTGKTPEEVAADIDVEAVVNAMLTPKRESALPPHAGTTDTRTAEISPRMDLGTVQTAPEATETAQETQVAASEPETFDLDKALSRPGVLNGRLAARAGQVAQREGAKARGLAGLPGMAGFDAAGQAGAAGVAAQANAQSQAVAGSQAVKSLSRMQTAFNAAERAGYAGGDMTASASAKAENRAMAAVKAATNASVANTSAMIGAANKAIAAVHAEIDARGYPAKAAKALKDAATRQVAQAMGLPTDGGYAPTKAGIAQAAKDAAATAQASRVGFATNGFNPDAVVAENTQVTVPAGLTQSPVDPMTGLPMAGMPTQEAIAQSQAPVQVQAKPTTKTAQTIFDATKWVDTKIKEGAQAVQTAVATASKKVAEAELPDAVKSALISAIANKAAEVGSRGVEEWLRLAKKKEAEERKRIAEQKAEAEAKAKKKGKGKSKPRSKVAIDQFALRLAQAA